MTWAISIARRLVFRFRLRKTFKRWYPELDNEIVKLEIEGIMELFFDKDNISWDYAKYAVQESVSYWGV